VGDERPSGLESSASAGLRVGNRVARRLRASSCYTVGLERLIVDLGKCEEKLSCTPSPLLQSASVDTVNEERLRGTISE
jgi:hypothetical protein